MNEKHLELINKILSRPIVSDMQTVDFSLHCNTNGRGPTWTASWKISGPLGVTKYVGESQHMLDMELKSSCCGAKVMGHPQSPSGDSTRCQKCSKECRTDYKDSLTIALERLLNRFNK